MLFWDPNGLEIYLFADDIENSVFKKLLDDWSVISGLIFSYDYDQDRNAWRLKASPGKGNWKGKTSSSAADLIMEAINSTRKIDFNINEAREGPAYSDFDPTSRRFDVGDDGLFTLGDGFVDLSPSAAERIQYGPLPTGPDWKPRIKEGADKLATDKAMIYLPESIYTPSGSDLEDLKLSSGLSMAALHELTHLFPKRLVNDKWEFFDDKKPVLLKEWRRWQSDEPMEDEKGVIATMNAKGYVVTQMNVIREELGLPIRKWYRSINISKHTDSQEEVIENFIYEFNTKGKRRSSVAWIKTLLQK